MLHIKTNFFFEYTVAYPKFIFSDFIADDLFGGGDSMDISWNSEEQKKFKIWKDGLSDFITRIREDIHFAILNGDLGAQAYGRGWRDFNGVDQLALAIEMLRNNPNSRRILVNAWNPPEVLAMPKGSLPPCHWSYQFAVDDDKLSILVNIRSWDLFLGGPFNIASYALLLMMVAQVTNLQAHEVVISSGDTHIYTNHVDAVETQLNRIPFALPTVEINPEISEIDEFSLSDFKLVGYEHHPRIKAEISI